MSNTIVVLVPGTTGSTLVGPNQAYDSDFPVWRLGVGLDLTSVRPDERDALAALERTDLRPGVLTSLNVKSGKGYDSFVRRFVALGFTAANARYDGPGTPAPDWGLPARPPAGDLLVAFPYDWRQDCTDTAKLLRDLLSTIDGLYASSDYRLFLVAHSMGGLICRAYLESVGTGDAWLSRIQGLVTLGTPHLGAPLALSAILGQVSLPPLKLLDVSVVETLVHNFVDTSFSDSSYELLPPPVLESAAPPPFTRYIQDGSEWYNLLDADLPAEVSAAVTAAAGQSLPAPDEYARDLQEAAAFFGALRYAGTASGSGPALPPYYCVVGLSSAGPTVVGFTYDGATQTLQPRTDATGTGGDQVVPAWSAGFTGRTTPVAGTYPAPGVNHFQLPADPGVQAQVAAWIGAVSGAAPGEGAARGTEAAAAR